MNIEEYFEIYTGGNDYIETWTPLALKEFAVAYHKMKMREYLDSVLKRVKS